MPNHFVHAPNGGVSPTRIRATTSQDLQLWARVDAGRRVAVIATPAGNYAAQVAKAATTAIPIVFGVGEHPVKLGLVASLARPGGNLTGINFFTAELAAKRLALLHELVPKAVRIAVLVNPANVPATESQLRDIPDAARAMGLQIQVLNASTSREIEAAFATLVRDRAAAEHVQVLYYHTPDGAE